MYHRFRLPTIWIPIDEHGQQLFTESQYTEANNIAELCEDIHKATQAKVQANMTTLVFF